MHGDIVNENEIFTRNYTYNMIDMSMSREELERLLAEKKRKDLSYSRILGSMCTYPHEVAVYALSLIHISEPTRPY